jgi:hypothetical protein
MLHLCRVQTGVTPKAPLKIAALPTEAPSSPFACLGVLVLPKGFGHPWGKSEASSLSLGQAEGFQPDS